MNESVTLLVGESNAEKPSCLSQYFSVQRRKNAQRFTGSKVNSETKAFEEDINNLVLQLDKFLESDEQEVSYLVLGKVQSGKTAHMVGCIAWAADSTISLVATFTGVTEALNDQTYQRFSKDLSSNENFVSIHPVPTSSRGNQYQELKEKIFRYVDWRLNSNTTGVSFQPLPVLITLKSKSRVQTLRKLLEELGEKFGPQMSALLIDDEADQASQNSKASKGEVAATYRAIAELRDVNIRNIHLSYTATPQAVLLTEKFGRLRPDFCTTIRPRSGYFGLEDAVSDDFLDNRIKITDPTNSTTISAIPKSLKKAILQFFWTAYIREKYPEIFYSESGLTAVQLQSRMNSTQMLIHESSRQANHEAMYKFVSSECSDLIKILGEYLNGQLANSSCETLLNWLSECFSEVYVRIGSPSIIESELDISNNQIRSLLSYLIDNRILIVNGDKNSSTSQFGIPVTDDEWEVRKTWILIGGDILGRGLTIPQLTTTYFLRQARTPNFDTVSQQMRFCGYRKDYVAATTIWAPQVIFDTFHYMFQIDSIVWERARKWDKEKTEIGKQLPAVMYASPVNAPLAPTRKSVRDPNLMDKRIGEYIATLSSIFSPIMVAANKNLINRWVEESNEVSIKFQTKNQEFRLFEHVEQRSLQRLLSSWNAPHYDEHQLRSAAELFDLSKNHLGLADYPISIFIDSLLLQTPVNDSVIENWINQIYVTRSIQNSNSSLDIQSWKKFFLNSTSEIKEWPKLHVGHVGDGQRKVRKSLRYDSSVLLIEPILGLRESRKRNSASAIGIGFTLFSPENFEIRIIGHL